jgi:hypothetical protein
MAGIRRLNSCYGELAGNCPRKKTHKYNLGHEDPGLDATPDGFLLGDPAGLLQKG